MQSSSCPLGVWIVYETVFYDKDGEHRLSSVEGNLLLAIYKAFTGLNKPGTLTALRHSVAVFDTETGRELYADTALRKEHGPSLPMIEGVPLAIYIYQGVVKYALWEPRGSSRRRLLDEYVKQKAIDNDDKVTIGPVEAGVDVGVCFCCHCKRIRYLMTYAGDQSTPPEYDEYCEHLNCRLYADFCNGDGFEEVGP